MAKKHTITFSEEGAGMMPIELWEIAQLLAERRGEAPLDTLAAIVAGLICRDKADHERLNKFMAAHEAVDAGYCKAEGIRDVQRYSERKGYLELKTALRESLARAALG